MDIHEIARMLGRNGGLKAASNMTKEQRIERAKKASEAARLKRIEKKP